MAHAHFSTSIVHGLLRGYNLSRAHTSFFCLASFTSGSLILVQKASGSDIFMVDLENTFEPIIVQSYFVVSLDLWSIFLGKKETDVDRCI